jgi:hypothetical protein
LALILAAWIYMLLTYKHRARVIDLGKQGIERDFKARDYVKNGVRYWQLDKERDKELKLMPVPPAEAINIAKGGKKSVEAIRTETGEYIFLDRTIQVPKPPEVREIPKEILSIADEVIRAQMTKDYIKLKQLEWLKEQKSKGMVIEAYQPFTSKQRMILVNNFTKANERKGHSWKENLPTIVSVSALVILVLMLMIFWGDIAQPAITSKEITKSIVETQQENLLLLQEVKQGQQRILAEQEQIKQAIG